MEKEEIKYLDEILEKLTEIEKELEDYYNYKPEETNEHVPMPIIESLKGLRYAIANLIDRKSDVKLLIFLKQ